jgi:hypothetical protein
MDAKLERSFTAVSTRADSRRLERSTANLQMTLQGTKSRHKVWAVDISLLGARIRSTEVLVPGQMVLLIPSERSQTVYPCRVVWISPSGPQLYTEAGLEFRSFGRRPS